MSILMKTGLKRFINNPLIIIIKSKHFFNRNMCTITQNLKSIFFKSIEAVHPPSLIKKHVYLKDHILHVYDKEYIVNNNCYLVGFGKAVYEMSLELEKTLGEHLVKGCVSIPPGTSNPEHKTRVVYLEGAANNLPDVEAELAAKQIANLVESLSEKDIIFVLISGGGSALLPAPLPSIPLEDKTKLIKILANNGASIIELNCVRKKLSTLKGGGLACLAHPAKLIALILSDVIGDPLGFIASGPTVPNTDEREKATQLILKYTESVCNLPQSIQDFLRFTDNNPGTNIPIIDGNYEHVTNFLIGNNVLALSAAEQHAKCLGYDPIILSNCVSGDVEDISKAYSSIALEFYLNIKNSSTIMKLKNELIKYKDLLKLTDETINQLLVKLKSNRKKCLIFGGEPTVQVKGNGKGGRNQHLALLFSAQLDRKILDYNVGVTPLDISFLSCGTDGIDGPTNAAGAIGFNGLTNNGLNVQEYLERNDSYNFFKQFSNGQFMIKTGHTGTNVMDVHLIILNIF